MTTRLALRHLPRALLFAVAVGVGGCSDSDDDGGNGGGDAVPDDDTPGEGTTDGMPGGGTTDDDMEGGAGDTNGGTNGDLATALGLDELSGDVGEIGHVSIEQRGVGRVRGNFVRFPVDIPALSAVEGFQPPLDTCKVTPFPLRVGFFPFDFEDIDVETVSAGEQLVFTGPSGTFLSLPREQISGLSTYALLDGESSVPLPVPSDLSLDVPGDDFPAFADVSVPNPVPLTGVTPGASETVDADTVFRWDAGDDPDAYIEISARAVVPGGRLSNSTSVGCFVRDDGEFAFAAGTRAELGDFSTSGAVIARTGLTILGRGDALFVVSNSRAD